MINIVNQFLARGLKFADLFWVAGGAVGLFFLIRGLGALIENRQENKKSDWWEDSGPWM